MGERKVTFETAKLAKEKGFNLECLHYYDKNGCKPDRWESSGSSTDTDVPIYLEEFYHNYNSKGWANVECSAPTQSLLQKWLRDEHNTTILILDCAGKKLFWYEVGRLHAGGTDVDTSEDPEHETFEDCLEEALQQALELI